MALRITVKGKPVDKRNIPLTPTEEIDYVLRANIPEQFREQLDRHMLNREASYAILHGQPAYIHHDIRRFAEENNLSWRLYDPRYGNPED